MTCQASSNPDSGKSTITMAFEAVPMCQSSIIQRGRSLSAAKNLQQLGKLRIGAACSLVFRQNKAKDRKNKVLLAYFPNEFKTALAQSILTAKHLQRVVLAYFDFIDEPSFTRVVPIEEIRAKEGNLSIPLCVGEKTQAQTDAAAETATAALLAALAVWLESSRKVNDSPQTLLTALAK